MTLFQRIRPVLLPLVVVAVSCWLVGVDLWQYTPFIPVALAALIFSRIEHDSLKLLMGMSMQEYKSQGGERNDSKLRQLSLIKHKFRDKLVYTLGVLNVGLTSYILGVAPRYFYIWYSIKAVVLLTTRYIDFRSRNEHYFFWDMCYWANGTCLVYIWLFPKSDMLYQMLFVIANGPLAWSIIAFGNALIFHSASSTTSVFIHLEPLLLTYSIRWNQEELGDLFTICDGPCSEVSVLGMIYDGITKFYLIWVILYYVYVLGYKHPKIKKKGYTTLWDWYTNENPIFHRIHRNEMVNKFAYILLHFTLGTAATSAAGLMWNSQVAHLVFGLFMITCAIWNASTHYFDQFAAEYEKNMRIRLGLTSPSEIARAHVSTRPPEELKEEEDNWNENHADLLKAVFNKLSEVADSPKDTISLADDLTYDLSFGSLALSEIKGWLESEYNAQDVNVKDMETVRDIVRFAIAGIERAGDDSQFNATAPEGWEESEKAVSKRSPVEIKTFPGVPATLQSCFMYKMRELGQHPITGDALSGVLSAEKLQIGSCLLADYLKAHDADILGRSKYVGIMMPATAGFGVLAMGVLLAGKIPVLINWTLGSKNLRHVLKVTNLSVILTAKAFVAKLPKSTDLTPLADCMLFMEDVKKDFYIMDMLWQKIAINYFGSGFLISKYGLKKLDEDDTALVLFTSGSESAPKGVPLTHRNVISNIEGVLKVAGLQTSDCIMGILPPFHSFGWTVTSMIPLLTGCKACYYPNPTEYTAVAREISKWKATVYAGTPTFFSGVLKAAPKGKWNHNLRLCVTGAEALSEDLRNEAIKNWGIRDICEGYGITECAPVVSCNVPGKEASGVGYPIPNGTEIRIISLDKTKVLKLGERGLIAVRGPGIFKGYIGTKKDPFLTIPGEQGTWYDTGDLGILKKDGSLVLKGRLKRFVKIAGEMVSLGALESTLRKKWKADEEGERVAIEGLEKAGMKTVLAVFSTIPNLKLDDVNGELRDAGFGAVMFPNVIINVSDIPLLGTGKTDFRTLKALLLKRYPQMTPT